MDRRVLVADPGLGSTGNRFADLPEAGDVLKGPDGNILASLGKFTVWTAGVPVEYSTFALALAAATAGDIIYVPPGSYTGNWTVPNEVSILARGAEFTGAGGGGLNVGVFEFAGQGSVCCKKVSASGENAFLIGNSVSACDTGYCDVEKIELTSGGGGFVNLSFTAGGILYSRCKTIHAGDSCIAVGSVSGSCGHQHIDIGDIYLAGDSAQGVITALTANHDIVGRIDHILQIGTPTGTVGLNVQTGEINLMVNTIDADQDWNVAAAGTLRLFYGKVSGTGVGAGTILTSTPA